MTRWDVADAVLISRLTPLERLMMLVLIKRADHESAAIPAQFSPSLTTLTRDTGMSRSSVTKTLNSLELAGWIVRGRPPKEDQLRHHARTEYAMLIPGASPRDGLGLGRDTDQPGSRHGPELVRDTDIASPRDGLNHYFSTGSSGSSAASSGRDPEPSGSRPPEPAVTPRKTGYRPDEMQPCPECWARTGELCEDPYAGQPKSHYHPGRLPRPECA